MVIDTSIFIEHLRATDKTSTILYSLAREQSICLSSITLYELYMGATDPAKLQDVHYLTDNLPIIPFEEEAAKKAGEIYHELRLENKMIEFRDIFIGACCLVNDLPVKTLNKKDFKRIKGLIVK